MLDMAIDIALTLFSGHMHGAEYSYLSGLPVTGLPVIGAANAATPEFPAIFALAEPRKPESSVFEHATAVFFAAGILVALMVQGLSRFTTFIKPLSNASWIIAGLGLLLCLEELSYGEALIGYPRLMILGKPIDSLHDVLLLSKQILKLAKLHIGVVAYGGLIAVYLGAFGYIVYRLRSFAFAFLRTLPYNGAYFMLSLSLFLLFYTQVSETFLGGTAFSLFEEIFEFIASFLWFFAFVFSLIMKPHPAETGYMSYRKPVTVDVQSPAE